MKGRAHWRFARIFVLFAVIAALVSVLGMAGFAAEPVTDEPECYLSGDLNGDGELDTKDPIYALYSGFFGNESYPISQEWDYDGNGKHNSRDAIELLYAYYDMSDVITKGMVHDYHAPVWSWNHAGDTVSVSVTFKCGCQDAVTVSYGQEGHALSIVELEEQRVEAGCLTAGQQVYQATITYDSKQYTSEPYTVTVPAKGHTTEGLVKVEGQADYHGKYCSVCRSYVSAAEHNWQEGETVASPMPCLTPGLQKYQCADCGAEKAVELSLAEHNFQYMEKGDTLYDDSCCKYVKHYACSVCAAEKTPEQKDYYISHDFVATSKKAATCKVDGSLVYTCSKCPAQKEETIASTGEEHKWDAGVTENGVTTYTCQENGCGQQKTAIVAAPDGAISKDDLNTSSEVELKNATMDLSKVDKSTLEDEIKLNVGTHDLDTVLEAVGGAAAEAKDDIKTDKVYDFSMTNTQGDPVAFGGSITITLPYKLSQGEDITDIGVYYISDEGNLERISATWSNGFITFTVEHFSYYTVRRLTPEERCEQYGHLWTESTKAATCLVDGYTKEVCQRCTAQRNEVVIPAAGKHTYAVNEALGKAATCLVDGFTVEECAACGHQQRTIVKATGHAMQTVTLTAAKCGADGAHVTGCANCDYTKTEKLPALVHDYGTEATRVVAATCTAGGYEVYTCVHCGGTVRRNETQPTGHTFEVLENAWSWAEDYSSATVTLTCHCSATKELKAVATVSKGTCTGAGSAKVVISYNDKKFQDERVTGSAPGHTPGESWVTSGTQHYHLCAVCGDKVDIATHNFGEGTVTKAPTCVNTGIESFFCGVCNYEKQVSVPATGKHDIVGGVCANCGFREDVCDHSELYPSKFDISGFDICQGTELVLFSCGCGQQQRLELVGEWACQIVESDGTEVVDDYGMITKVNTGRCEICGLVVEAVSGRTIAQDECAIYDIDQGRLILDGKTLFQFTYADPESRMEHPVVKVTEQVSLADFGMCEGYVSKYTCPCGENIRYRRLSGCELVTDEGGNEMCVNCGVVLLWDYRHAYDGCAVTEHNTVTFVMQGKPVYSYTNTNTYTNHNDELVDVQLNGDSCTDGITATYVCQNCQREEIRTYQDHTAILGTFHDLTEQGMCGGYLYQDICPCGNGAASYSLVNNGCQWEYVYNEKLEGYYQQCVNCGTIQVNETIWGEPDADCRIQSLSFTIFYDENMVEKLRGVGMGQSWRHDYQYTYTMMGESCTDGVLMKGVCNRCGNENEDIRYDHRATLQSSIDLKALGLCGGYIQRYSCACGQESWENSSMDCRWDWVSDENGVELRQCPDCGACRRTTVTKLETIDSCTDRVRRVTTIEQGGKVVVQYENESTDEHHKMVYELELYEGATSCLDGFRMREYCQLCGVGAEDWRDVEEPDHYSYNVGYTLLCEEGLCGKMWLVAQGCACGESAGYNIQWENGGCSFDWLTDEATGEQRYVCRVCGAERRTELTKTRVEGTTCDYRYTYTYIYTKDGKELCRYSTSQVSTTHDIVYDFDMLGKTCADGYYLIEKCRDCAYSAKQEELRYDCCEQTTEKFYLVREHESVCGYVVWCYGHCACGARKTSYFMTEHCQFTTVDYGDMNTYAEQCVNCGVIITQSSTEQRIPGSCKVNGCMIRTAILDGKEICRVEKDHVSYNHIYVASGVFAEGADSCEDGYYLRQTCVYCGYTEVETEMRYSHESHRLAYYDLEAYGMCGGNIENYGCVCGEESRWQSGMICEWTYPDNGINGLRYCQKCDTYIIEQGEIEYIKEQCLQVGSITLTVTRDDEVLLALNGTVREKSHSYKMVNWTLDGSSCLDGYVADLACRYCDATSTSSGSWHSSWDVEVIDLKLEGACSGELRVSRCPCGELGNVDWYERCENTKSDSRREDQADGYAHYFEEEWCETCGMKKLREYYEVYPQGSCEGTRYYTDSYYLGDKLLYTYSGSDNSTSHNHQPTDCQLLEGAKDCTGGVLVTQTCKNCGDSYQYETTTHEQYIRERIDLRPYGSVCGGYLEDKACACGETQTVWFSDELECDMGKQEIAHWLPNVLDEVSQYNAAGSCSFYSYSYSYTCAVTDPQCGMKLRYFDGWIQEGCRAVHYQIWQLGYDPETGTCQREIKVAVEEKPYHDYTSTYEHEMENDICVHSIETCTCDCGSTYVCENWYDAKSRVTKRQRIAIEASKTSYNQQYREIYEYGYEGIRELLETYSEEYYTYSDGTVYGWETVHTYEPDGQCGYKAVRTYSNGEIDTWERQHADESGSCMTVYNGCSQPGVDTTEWDCDICGQITRVDVNYVEPTGHCWTPNENGAGFTCDRCGLENSNGADGTIIFEDLTGTYGNGVEYVIGYHNYSDSPFTVYVSAVRNAGTEDEAEEILEGIEPTFRDFETDGVDAVCFSKQAVADAANAAVPDGDFCIRITFVPADGNGTLDYAITLSSVAS